MDADRASTEDISSYPFVSGVGWLIQAIHIMPPEEQSPPRRLISEKRRLQNRQAQRNYSLPALDGRSKKIDAETIVGEKQRRRLEALENLVERQAHESQQLDSLSAEKNSDFFTSQQEFFMPSIPLLNESFGHLDDDSTRWGLGFDNATIFGNEGELDPLPSPLQSPWNKRARNLDIRDDLAFNNSRTQTLARQSKLWPTAVAKTSGTISIPDTTTSDPLNSFLSVFLLQKDVSISQKLADKIAHNKITLQDLLSLGLGALESGSPTVTDTEDFVPPQIRFGQKSKNHVYTDPIPNPRLGTIRITQVSFLSACLSNAAMLGLTPATTSNDAESPFYHGQPSKQAAEWEKSQFKDIKPDLRPTKSQLARSHHPYLDVLPFPTFRERAIALIHADSPVFDEEELCCDLLNDALVCWGSSLGARVGNSGAPWDIRSWEARPWFMKKWWFLIGGSEGELYQQTRWWCDMRGDTSGYAW